MAPRMLPTSKFFKLLQKSELTNAKMHWNLLVIYNEHAWCWSWMEFKPPLHIYVTKCHLTLWELICCFPCCLNHIVLLHRGPLNFKVLSKLTHTYVLLTCEGRGRLSVGLCLHHTLYYILIYKKAILCSFVLLGHGGKCFVLSCSCALCVSLRSWSISELGDPNSGWSIDEHRNWQRFFPNRYLL